MSDKVPRNVPRNGIHVVTGAATAFESTMIFVRWAESLRHPLTAERIKERWGVSRATSYRWLRAYKDAESRMAA